MNPRSDGRPHLNPLVICVKLQGAVQVVSLVLLSLAGVLVIWSVGTAVLSTVEAPDERPAPVYVESVVQSGPKLLFLLRSTEDANFSGTPVFIYDLNGELIARARLTIEENAPIDAYTLLATKGYFPAEGEYVLQVGGSSAVRVYVVPYNFPPVVIILYPPNGASFAAPADVTVEWNGYDPDGDSLTFTVDCGNGTTTTTTATSYTCSYSSTGTYTITVTASDGELSDSNSVTITLTDAPPTIISFTADPSTVNEDTQSTTLSCSASDNLALSSIAIYKNATDTTPVQTCTASPCSVSVIYYAPGVHYAKCVATDNAGLSSSATTTVTVNDITSPSVSLSATPSAVAVGDTVTLSCSASDNVGVSTITIYRDQGDATPATTCNNTTACSVDVIYLTYGTYTPECVATDPSGNSASATATVNVNDGAAPSIISFTASPSTVNEDTQSTTLACDASDNTNISSIKIYKNATDATPAKTCTINASSGSCSVSVIYYAPGTHYAECVVDDVSGLSSSKTTTVYVNDITSPTITSFTADPSSIPVNSSTTLSCSATDNVGISSIQIYKNSTDTTPVQTCSTSSCSATVTYTTAGTYTPKCVATDPSGNSSSKTTTITVTAVNNPPSIFITSPSNGATFEAPADVTIQWTASDPDGDSLSFTVDCGNGTTTTTTSTSYTCSYSSTGTYTITVTASDGELSASDSVTISITGTITIPEAPTINSFTANPSTVYVYQPTTLTCTVTDLDSQIVRVQIYSSYNSPVAKECIFSTPYNTSCSATVAYTTAGTYTAKCVVIDDSDNKVIATTKVEVVVISTLPV